MTSKTVAEVFPPGEILSEELKSRGWLQADLVAILGCDSGLLTAIISGKRSITAEVAQGLSEALGTTAEFWLNLQSAYQLSKTLSKTATQCGICGVVIADVVRLRGDEFFSLGVHETTSISCATCTMAFGPVQNEAQIERTRVSMGLADGEWFHHTAEVQAS